MNQPLSKRVVAEAVGTAMLLAAVVGWGIMGERLAAGNIAIALRIRPVDTPVFVVAQLAGAFVATAFFGWLKEPDE